MKKGHKVLKPLVGLIDEILKKTKGDPDKLSKIFGMQTMDGFKAFIAEYQKTGKNAAMPFMDVVGDGSELMGDAARAAEEFNSAMQSLYTSWQRFAHAELNGPVRSLAKTLDGLKEGTVQRWLKTAEYIALTVGSLVALSKTAGLIKPVIDLLRSQGGVPGPIATGPGKTLLPFMMGSAGPAGVAVGTLVVGSMMVRDAFDRSRDNSGLFEGYGSEQGSPGMWSGLVDAITRADREKYINLNITIDQNGRATTSSSDPNTGATVKLKRGSFGDTVQDLR
jgi:hypothetical protein